MIRCDWSIIANAIQGLLDGTEPKSQILIYHPDNTFAYCILTHGVPICNNLPSIYQWKMIAYDDDDGKFC